jgi:hypothetical protein
MARSGSRRGWVPGEGQVGLIAQTRSDSLSHPVIQSSPSTGSPNDQDMTRWYAAKPKQPHISSLEPYMFRIGPVAAASRAGDTSCWWRPGATNALSLASRYNDRSSAAGTFPAGVQPGLVDRGESNLI